MVHTLYEIYNALKKELKEMAEKTRGGMSPGDLDTIDKLTHAIKSVKTTIAMIEASDGEEDGYSGGWYRPMYYNDGGMGISERGSSSNRGGYSEMHGYSRRGRGRDSMGRFTRGRSYDSGDEHVMEQIRGMIGELPEDKRSEIERVLDR